MVERRLGWQPFLLLWAGLVTSCKVLVPNPGVYKAENLPNLMNSKSTLEKVTNHVNAIALEHILFPKRGSTSPEIIPCTDDVEVHFGELAEALGQWETGGSKGEGLGWVDVSEEDHDEDDLIKN